MTETLAVGGGKPPLTPLRWVFAIFGGLLMLFGGVFALYSVGFSVFIAIMERDGYAGLFTMLGVILGGIPAAFGYLILWLSVMRGRAPAAGA